MEHSQAFVGLDIVPHVRRPNTRQLILEADQLRVTLYHHVRRSDLIIGQLCGVIDENRGARQRARKLRESKPARKMPVLPTKSRSNGNL